MRAVTGLFALVLALPAAARPTQRELLDAFERQLKAVHEKAGPAMACVVVSRADAYPKPDAPPDYPGRLGGFDPAAFRKLNPDRLPLVRRLDLADPRGVLDHDSAAGVVIDPAGLVLTNFHAVEGATKVYVHLPGGKGSYADVHAADGRSDLAVLKLLTPPEGLAAVKFGTARVQPTGAAPATLLPGKLLVVLAHLPTGGFAPDRPGGTVTAVTRVQFPGVGAADEDAPRSVYRYAPLLEFEARTAPARSGAAVLTLDGELVGLTSTLAGTGGGGDGRLGYAVPLDANVRRIVDVLARGEEVEYGFLGIVYNRDFPGSIVVSAVSPRGPSDGKLVPGEAIVRINGVPTRTYADLLYHVGSTLAGHPIELGVRGPNGQARTVELTVGKFRNDQPSIAATRPAAVFGLRVDWGSVLSQVVTLTTPVPPGVMVREALPGSPAAEKFRALGEGRWLVTAVNGTPTPTPAEFYAAARGRESVRLTVLDPTDRVGPRTVTLP